MNIREAILQCLNDDLGLSKQDVEDLLNQELNNPEEEMDCEIIDMCIDVLAHMNNVQIPDVQVPEHVLYKR